MMTQRNMLHVDNRGRKIRKRRPRGRRAEEGWPRVSLALQQVVDFFQLHADLVNHLLALVEVFLCIIT